MKKWGMAFAIIIIITGVGYMGVNVAYQWWGRRLIYPESSKVTQFPGMGVVTKAVEPKIFVLPLGLGRPSFDELKNKAIYPESKYEVIEIPEQEQQLYTVGRVVGWEEIDGSSDKYLQVDTGSGEIRKYRVLFVPRESFAKPDMVNTLLAVEDVGWSRDSEDNNRVENVENGSMTNLGFERAQKIIKRGDVTVLTSVFSPPELSKRDENGNYIVALIVVRRAGGKKNL